MQAVVWMLVAVLGVAGCAKPQGSVVAEAGGEKIYERQLEQEAALARARGVPLDTPGTDQLARFNNHMVPLLIDAALLRQEAERRGITVSPEEIEREMRADRERHESEEVYRRVLESYRMTEDELRARVRQSRLIERLAKSLEEQATATDDEVRAYFEKHRDRFRTPTRASARVLSAGGDEQAADLMRRLRAGETFESLARHAPTPDAVMGGARLEIVEGTIDPVLEAAAFSAPLGQLVGPVRAQGLQRYVIKVESRTPSVPLSFTQVRETAQAQLRREKAQEAIRQLVLRLREERGFRVVRVYPTLTPTPKSTPTP